jgi:hypothetical protein
MIMRLPRQSDLHAGPSRLPAVQTITWSLFAGVAVWLQSGMWWALAAAAGCAVLFLAVPTRPSGPHR